MSVKRINAKNNLAAHKKKLIVSDLAPARYNPRKIADDADARLAASMERFGDLSGVVFNRRSGSLVGGHQRVRHIPANAEITIVGQTRKPNAQGTVGTGFIDVDGERWVYREVDVNAKTERAMNVAANRQGGEWDLPKLTDVLAELGNDDFDMDLTGFSAAELDEILAPAPMEDAENPLGGEGAPKDNECPRCLYTW